METHTINASGRIIGRLATGVAILLRGKHRPDFQPNRMPGVEVVITHTDKLSATGNKMAAKRYFRHSGYPGGAKFTLLKDAFARDSRKVFREVVAGMLPKNKLRPRLLKNLKLYRNDVNQ